MWLSDTCIPNRGTKNICTLTPQILSVGGGRLIVCFWWTTLRSVEYVFQGCAKAVDVKTMEWRGGGRRALPFPLPRPKPNLLCKFCLAWAFLDIILPFCIQLIDKIDIIRAAGRQIYFVRITCRQIYPYQSCPSRSVGKSSHVIDVSRQI